MSSIFASLLVAACIFAGGIAGLFLHRIIPPGHLTKETHDVIKLGTGMLSVLASLVLGLLIATARTSYDATDLAIRNYAAELALLNETLRDYGGPAAAPRDVLREFTQGFLQAGWPTDGTQAGIVDNDKTRVLLEHVRESIRALKPVDREQQALQNEAIVTSMNLLRQRWVLIVQQRSSVQRVVLVILVCWVTVIFMSFGLSAPRNATVATSLLICALAIGGSVFLIMEMDRPLQGIMRISSGPVENALAHMQW